MQQALLSFGLISLVLTVTPGIDMALALRSTLTSGKRSGALAVAGITCGLLAWGVAASLGGALLLSVSETAYRVVSLAGAAYLITLGVILIVRTFRGHTVEHTERTVVDPSGFRSFVTGFVTNLLNPKIGVFYIATIPQFIPAGASALGTGLTLAALHAVMTVLWLGFVVLTASYARRWLSNLRALRIIDRITGGVLILFGARMLTAGRFA